MKAWYNFKSEEALEQQLAAPLLAVSWSEMLFLAV